MEFDLVFEILEINLEFDLVFEIILKINFEFDLGFEIIENQFDLPVVNKILNIKLWNAFFRQQIGKKLSLFYYSMAGSQPRVTVLQFPNSRSPLIIYEV